MDIAAPSLVPSSYAIRSASVREAFGKLRGVNGNSLAARRFREIVGNLADDVGGPDKVSEPQKIAIRQIATMTMRIEALQAQVLTGEFVDDEELVRLSNAVARLLHRLGLKKRPERKLSVPEYLARRDAMRANGG